MIRLAMREIYPQSTLRVEFEDVGSKYFVGEISENLPTQNFADWMQQQTRSSILLLRIFRNCITAG
jgi:hypothetical protein